eukprot:Clim_evm10s64 gene=Clim_evmTU10s64
MNEADQKSLLKKIFGLLDADQNGTIDVHEILTCLQAVDPTKTFRDAMEFLQAVDTDMNGSITFDEFSEGVEKHAVDLKQIYLGAKEMSQSNSNSDPGDWVKYDEIISNDAEAMFDDPEEMAKANAERQTSMHQEEEKQRSRAVLSAREMQKALKCFNSIDTDQSGSIEVEELHAVLSEWRPDLADTAAPEMLALMDVDGNGQITIDEFLEGIARLNLDIEQFTRSAHAVKERQSRSRTNMSDASMGSTLSTVSGITSEWEILPSEITMKGVLGEGTFGVVEEGRWRGATVAIKRLKVGHMSQDLQAEFAAEVTLLSKLRHPNCMLFLGAYMGPETPFIVTEYLAGGSLFDALFRRRITVTWSLYMSIMRQTALGLNYLHLTRPCIIHRDLKTLNILLDHSNNVKLADFGLSAVVDNAKKMRGQVGTPVYMAPELLQNQEYNEKVDVYAYGMMAYEVFFRQIPFQEMPHFRVAVAVGVQGARPPIPENAPHAVRKLIEVNWAQNPDKRPTMQQVLNYLDRIDKAGSKG